VKSFRSSIQVLLILREQEEKNSLEAYARSLQARQLLLNQQTMEKFLEIRKKIYDRQALQSEQKAMDELAQRQASPALSWKKTSDLT
jgi:predicted Ser/Thr protein kinase